MLLKQKTLCEKLGITAQTLNIYLCREEFSHIKKIKKNRFVYYENISLLDIKKIKELFRIKKKSLNCQEPILKDFSKKKKFKCHNCGTIFVDFGEYYKTLKEIEIESDLILLNSQNKALLKQNESLQKENLELRLKIEDLEND